MPKLSANFESPRSRNTRVAPKNNRSRTGDNQTCLNANRSSLLVKSVFGCASDNSSRLAQEEGFYRDLHDGYRKQFERLGQPPGTVGVAAENPDDADGMLAAYAALDTVVVRGLASARLETMDRVATAAAPR